MVDGPLRYVVLWTPRGKSKAQKQEQLALRDMCNSLAILLVLDVYSKIEFYLSSFRLGPIFLPGDSRFKRRRQLYGGRRTYSILDVS